MKTPRCFEAGSRCARSRCSPGSILVASAIVAMLESRLGLPPWDVFHMGIAAHTPLSLGTASVVVGLVIVVVAWVAGSATRVRDHRERRGDRGLHRHAGLRCTRRAALRGAAAVRIGLVALGVFLFGVGSAFYIGAGLGAGPRDSLMMALTKRTGHRIGVVRGAMEMTVLVAGLLLGGEAGLGTVALALLVGPSVELAFWMLLRLGLASPGPLHAPEFGPLDVG